MRPCVDNRVETTFTAERGGTLLTMRMTLPDAATREAMLATGMADGMEMGYARLDRRWEQVTHDRRGVGA